MKVLVTGHKGFIGSHVFDFLSDIFDVDGLDRPDDIENFVDVLSLIHISEPTRPY